MYNLRPITPYLDENLTSLSNTHFLSMINDQISRLKNTFLLPKREMPNYSHLERPSFVVKLALFRAKRQTELHSNQAFPGTRLRLHVLSSFGRSSLQCSARTPVDGWIVQRAQCSRSSRKNERVVLAPASCVPLEIRLIWTCCFLPGLIRHHS